MNLYPLLFVICLITVTVTILAFKVGQKNGRGASWHEQEIYTACFGGPNYDLHLNYVYFDKACNWCERQISLNLDPDNEYSLANEFLKSGNIKWCKNDKDGIYFGTALHYAKEWDKLKKK